MVTQLHPAREKKREGHEHILYGFFLEVGHYIYYIPLPGNTK